MLSSRYLPDVHVTFTAGFRWAMNFQGLASLLRHARRIAKLWQSNVRFLRAPWDFLNLNRLRAPRVFSGWS